METFSAEMALSPISETISIVTGMKELVAKSGMV